MVEKPMEHNTTCTSEEHGTHLCQLMCEGFHLNHPQEYREIVQDANFRCQNCSRTAGKSEDICEPIPL